MKKIVKNETDMLDLINKVQAQLVVLERKIDILINRAPSEPKLLPTSLVNSPRQETRPNDQNKGRMKFTAICADCQKECTIPFKPSGDRPVYCQDCFSRRKVIKMSGMTVVDKPKETAPAATVINKVVEVQESPTKKKKKTVTVKKAPAKKKVTAKKK